MTDYQRVALVTGSARRIGAAIARHLHAHGYRVALHAHSSTEEMQSLAFDLESERPGSVLAVEADLRDPAALPDMLEQVVSHFGQLDALVNNASNFFPTPFGQVQPSQWDELLAVNARAPFFLAQVAAPHLIRQRGAIVNLTDLHATQPLRDYPAYSIAKAALEMVTRSLALELAPHVRVNAVAPGAILWPEEGKSELAKQKLMERTPLGRIGTPHEIASAVRWLLDDAGYITGQTLRLDGGRTLT
ncbi:pteridine reductase [Stenotrophomonas sp. ATCM1_4]|uniref:pteridine reductase n=1 Tax=Stenotrophomonas sp. ATCM1_4 TaxID=2259330 RepID=UPI00104EB143|nr:pteridine reductase [Stenotrophomonas sp. ATCM1_4]TDB29824.1 pteridine reductase [Stenotrophomonas sp. ATCM1_4]